VPIKKLESQESEADAPTNAPSDSWMEGFRRALTSFVTPRAVREAQAALVIQCAARNYLARRRVHYLRTMRRLVTLMAGRERKYAMMIQARWRGKMEARKLAEIAKIQAAAKGRIERRKLEQQKSVLVFTENRAAKVIQKHGSLQVEKSRMMRECRGILEKQGRKYALGKWEMVVWQERFVFLTKDGLVYQHIKSNSEPTGAEKAIPYASMETVKALLGDVLYLKCNKRGYNFQLGSPAECEMWATNVVQLAQCAGFDVPGFVVMPPEAGAAVVEPTGADEPPAEKAAE